MTQRARAEQLAEQLGHRVSRAFAVQEIESALREAAIEALEEAAVDCNFSVSVKAGNWLKARASALRAGRDEQTEKMQDDSLLGSTVPGIADGPPSTSGGQR